MIYRIKKREKYCTLPNAIFLDANLTAKAKGILGHLLCRPNDWKVYQGEMVRHFKDGVASIRSGVKELIDVGYVHRMQTKGNGGKFREWEYWVFEYPVMDLEGELSRIEKERVEDEIDDWQLREDVAEKRRESFELMEGGRCRKRKNGVKV